MILFQATWGQLNTHLKDNSALAGKLKRRVIFFTAIRLEVDYNVQPNHFT